LRSFKQEHALDDGPDEAGSTNDVILLSCVPLAFMKRNE
jgi:hypothetical protein